MVLNIHQYIKEFPTIFHHSTIQINIKTKIIILQIIYIDEGYLGSTIYMFASHSVSTALDLQIRDMFVYTFRTVL